MAKNVVVVGTQWGDEGKGKIVDWLTDHAKGVVRFQGGHNAGHTLVIGQTEYKLNLVPSGIVREGVACFIGNGVVLDAHHLLSEIRTLEAGGRAGENEHGHDLDLLMEGTLALLGEVRRAEDGGAEDLTAVEELTGDQAGLDRLADSDVIGDQEADRRLTKGHEQRDELVGPRLDGDAGEAA